MALFWYNQPLFIEVDYVKKTAEFSVVFRDKKREESFMEKHKIGTKSFTRDSEDISSEFNPMKVRCQIEGFNKDVVQARASVLFDVLNSIAVDASFTNKSEENNLITYDERTLATTFKIL